jgi:transposase
VSHEGHRLPEKFFGGPTWAAKLARLSVSAPLTLILETCRASIEARVAAEPQRTARLPAMQDPRGLLLESIPAMGPLTARVLRRALEDARRVDDQKAVANDGALAPTMYQRGAVRQWGRINRDGRREGRRVLWPCAHTVARMKSHGAKPLPQFVARIARRRGKTSAVGALARKLLTTAYGGLKSGERDDPRKLEPAKA